MDAVLFVRFNTKPTERLGECNKITYHVRKKIQNICIHHMCPNNTVCFRNAREFMQIANVYLK